MTIKRFILTVNQYRKAGKHNWYSIVQEVEGKHIEIKGYQTWLQIYRVDGIQYGNCMDVSVKQFNQDLLAPFNA